MIATPTTTSEKLKATPYNLNHKVHRFALTFSQRVSTKIEHSLSSYNHIDRSIFKKYFAPEKLLFCQLSWCFLPSISSMSGATMRSVVETLAIIEIYLRASILHGKVMNRVETEREKHEQNTQMILFGDMLISACVNQAFHLTNPTLKNELNSLIYQLGLKSINSSLKQKQVEKENQTSAIFHWMDWLGLIPKIITVIDNTDNKNNQSTRSGVHNIFFENLAKKIAGENVLNHTSSKDKYLRHLFSILEKLPPEMPLIKRNSCSALIFHFFSTASF